MLHQYDRYMKTVISLIPGALSELFVHATTSGELTLVDRYGIKAALLDDSLSEEEQRILNCLLRAVIKGRISVVNELSALF
ncbi:MAG: hypothetical protein AAF651_00630 [Cyanobacteria bacterium P01_C01_bin.73]